MTASEPFWPMATKTYHNTTYPRIDPSRPELSTKGKNVVITGGGSGLGRHFARAFGISGTTNLALIGRTERTLLETKKEVQEKNPDTRVWTYVADLVEAASIERALATFSRDINGWVDILIANAAFLDDIVPIEAADPERWWKCFEINVKGNFNLIRGFAPVAANNACVVDVSTAVAHLEYPANYSSYQASKLAQTSLFTHVQGENPEWHVVHFHPGVIGGTEMDEKTIARGLKLPHDDPSLPAHFAVWLVSPEAKFAKGKLLWAAWDVDELEAMSKEFVGKSKFTIGLLGWPGNA